MPEDKKDRRRSSAAKTDLARRIAEQSRRMARTSQRFEEFLLKLLRWFSTALDKILFNRKYSRWVALALAVIMYMAVNANSWRSLTTGMTSSRSRSNVTVSAQYNSDAFELSGLPSTCDITITGDATSVTTAFNSDGTIIADLEGLSEGTHNVKLKAEGFGDSVNVKIDPSNVTVTLKKKTTEQFDLSYDLVNQDKMDSKYSVGTPEFEYTKVNVRASRDTLNTIAFIRALIDVSGQTSDFDQDARLVAYDADGQVVNADIVPDTVHVHVPVSSISKTVGIQVQVSGAVPDGKAIASIGLDQQTVTIYGSQSVLDGIDKVTVTLDASTLTKDATVLRPITLPSGVSSASISQVTMTVKLGDETSRTIDNVKINYKNNTGNYTATQPDGKTTTSVTVYGTADNIKAVSADDIMVYIDMSDAQPGLQTFDLQIDQPENGLVRYELLEDTYELNVIGDTTQDTQTEGDTNNG